MSLEFVGQSRASLCFYLPRDLGTHPAHSFPGKHTAFAAASVSPLGHRLKKERDYEHFAPAPGRHQTEASLSSDAVAMIGGMSAMSAQASGGLERRPRALRLSRAMRNPVLSPDGEHVARVGEVIVDYREGRIEYVRIELGTSDDRDAEVRSLLVPWSQFTVSPDRHHLVIAIKPEVLHGASSRHGDSEPPDA